MIDASFIQKVLDIAEPKLMEVNGRQYSSHELIEVKPNGARELLGNNLSCMVDYVKQVKETFKKMFIQIFSPSIVYLMTVADEVYRQRESLLRVEAKTGGTATFNHYHGQEMFILHLHSYFVRDEVVENLLQIVSNIQSEDVRIDEDDGFSQQVTTRNGVARLANVTVPNPVKLRPYQTFAEIEQPENLFVFRVIKASRDGDGPMFGLFDNGSGLWELKATQEIKDYFKKKLPEIPVIG